MCQKKSERKAPLTRMSGNPKSGCHVGPPAESFARGWPSLVDQPLTSVARFTVVREESESHGGQGSEFSWQVNRKKKRPRLRARLSSQGVVAQGAATACLSNLESKLGSQTRRASSDWRAAPSQVTHSDTLRDRVGFRPGGLPWRRREKNLLPDHSQESMVVSRMEGGRAQEKTSACAVSDAFENPQCTVGASCPGFGSHYIRWACKRRTTILAPCGYSIGSSKVSPDHEHRRGSRSRCRLHESYFTTAPSPIQGAGPLSGQLSCEF